uniref:Uncharacterized protein n=5 Tax=Cercopithecinae TaxID=9528 RepID=A0A2K5KIL0_CERAT|nr:unnamed protein product [Macaca fascicularis]
MSLFKNVYLEVGLIKKSFYFQRNELNWTTHPQLQNSYQYGLLYLSINSSVLITSKEVLYIFIDYKIYQRKCIYQI